MECVSAYIFVNAHLNYLSIAFTNTYRYKPITITMRQILKVKTILVLIITILCACSPQEISIQEIDLTNHSRGRILELDELMSDIRIVRLETGKEYLIPQYYRSFVGEKYILVLTGKSILQFDQDGNFIRILARQGKGPGEYIGISEFDVDKNESKFYIHDWGNSHYLSGYNLETGEALPRIILTYNDVSTFIFADDHILFISDWFSTREMYTQFFEGELLDTLTNLFRKSYVSYSGRGEYLKNQDGNIYYLDQETDSLFVLNGVQKSVVYYFKVDNRYNFDTNLIGNEVRIIMQSENKFMFTIYKMHVERIRSGASTKLDGKYFFLWDNKTKTTDYISGFFHNYFEIAVENLPLESSGGVNCLKYSALEFKELLIKALENNNLDPKKANRFRKLNSMIIEEDNPILLVGKMVD